MFLPLGLRSSRTPFLKFGYGLRHTMVLCYIAPIPFRTTLIISDLRPSLSNILITFCSCSDLEFTKNFTRTFSSATLLASPPPAKELCIYPTCLRLASGYSSTDFLDACSVTSYRLSSTSFTLCAVCASTVCWMYFNLQSSLPLSKINNLTLIRVNKPRHFTKLLIWVTPFGPCVIKKLADFTIAVVSSLTL